MKTTLATGAILAGLCIGSTYEQLHPLDYQRGLEYCTSIYDQCKEISAQYNVDAKTVLAIGFPEVCRYSSLKDEIEYSALIYFSTDSNSTVDFSIGVFQMKPSFVAQLEAIIDTDTLFISQKPRFQYSNSEAKKVDRINRLEDTRWQLHYLCALVKYLDHQFKGDFNTQAGRASFYAAAYNYGFKAPKSEIISWQSKAAFPHGLDSPFENHRYSEIAKSFYENEEL